MAAWLRLESDHGGWSIEDSGQMRSTIRFLKRPCDQFPALVFFLGRSTKKQALRCLLPHNNTTRQGAPGIAKIHLNSVDTDAHHPNLFIDGDLDKPKSVNTAYNVSARVDKSLVRRHRLHRDAGQSHAGLRDYLFRRCILPFVHLLCVFVDDLVESEMISDWVSPSSLKGTSAHPRVVIILAKQSNQGKAEEIAADATHRGCTVSILDLHGRLDLSGPARFDPLRSLIRRELAVELEGRHTQGLLYSATHLESLLTRAVRHAAEHPGTDFDVVSAVRENNPVPPGIKQHLQNVLSVASEAQLSFQDAAVFIASALVVDAFPPGMHAFDPGLVFDRLYADPCKQAWQAIAPNDVQKADDRVRGEFIRLLDLVRPRGRAINLRGLVLRSSRTWAQLKTNVTCLFCLLRGTCDVLPCGHAICEVCIRRLGDHAQAEYHFRMKICQICGDTFDYMIRLLPPTQRPSILVLDGGGIRGAISLGFLQALERYTELRHFHLTVATSVGALIAFYRTLLCYSAEHAQEVFKSFGHGIFPQGPYTVLDFVTSMLADGRYNSDILDSALAKALTKQLRLFETSVAQPSGSLVAVTASHVEKNGSLCLFTNYRPSERMDERTSYDIITPKRVVDEPFLWQVGRCAVAALGYFKPHHLPGLGTFQDGGVCANCPLRVALHESKLLWPSGSRPNLIVSIGTGFLDQEPPGITSRASSRLSRVLTRGYVKRAKDVFLNSPAVDGNKGWKDARDSIPEALKDDVFRLDLPLQARLPELDDAARIDDLSNSAFNIPDALARSLQTTSFFFELDEEPAYWGYLYHCQGSILCDKLDPSALLSQLQRDLPNAQFVTGSGEHLGLVVDHNGCENCGYYRKQVNLSVSCLDDIIQLGVASGSIFSKIGGFPSSIQAISNDQQQNAPFGRADHSTYQWARSRQCYCTTGSKRGIPGVAVRLPSKRPRLEGK
ncbi:hypothetical protein BGW36DRAFT_304357 [Talaromyces proteolyticus]|uniref:PNPLA domain-containing protein n=1 Tax=Talaromyces proteolyticus TaxID=1131652 RepID=A0AAD4PWC0_9EURO|nr:uncharacterized protein BGW36DRAFT_304357 [Talaromyces proteolyticus]KAH8691842.1 hypothetical protein BGW36DRAFT_304357 [Talaromyces proteolyticus]